MNQIFHNKIKSLKINMLQLKIKGKNFHYQVYDITKFLNKKKTKLNLKL